MISKYNGTDVLWNTDDDQGTHLESSTVKYHSSRISSSSSTMVVVTLVLVEQYDGGIRRSTGSSSSKYSITSGTTELDIDFSTSGKYPSKTSKRRSRSTRCPPLRLSVIREDQKKSHPDITVFSLMISTQYITESIYSCMSIYINI